MSGAWLKFWGAWVVAGVALLVTGGVMVAGLGAPARAVTASEAMGLPRRDRLVTLTEGLEDGPRVWESLLTTPRLVPVDTNRTHAVRMGKDELDARLIGAEVLVQWPLTFGRIECQTVRPGAGEGDLQGLQVLSPLDGLDGRVWVLSPWCAALDEARAWEARGSYRGALGRFDDLGTNVPALGYSAAEIRAYAKDEMGLVIPEDALVLLEGRARGDGAPARASFARAAGTDGSVIVRLASVGSVTGPVTGLLRGGRLRGWEGELPGLLGVTESSRSRMLDTTVTVESRMAARVGIAGWVVGGGVGLVVAGTVGLVRARRGGQMDGGGISLEQANALGIPRPGPTISHTGSTGVGAGRTTEDAALEAEMARWTSAGEVGAKEAVRDAA